MKKYISYLLTLLTVLMLFTVTAGAETGSTSFVFRYPEAFENAKKHYSAFSKTIDTARSDIPVPGNVLSAAYAKDTGLTETENMVAQGLWFTDEYILVTAYDSAKKYDSLLYVLSNGEEHELLSVIVLPDKNHSGGVTTDGRNIYIARSEEGISYFSFERLQKAVGQRGVYILEAYDGTVKTEKTASFVTYYENTVWVGEFNEKTESYLCDYTVSEGGSLIRGDRTLIMPKKLQGAAFFEQNGITYLFASCSYGRTNTSDVYIYEVGEATNKQLYRYAFPPMSEEAAYHDGRVYLIFESSAAYYSTGESRCPTPVDRIVALDTDALTDEKTEDRISDLFSRVRDFFLKAGDFFVSRFRKYLNSTVC